MARPLPVAIEGPSIVIELGHSTVSAGFGGDCHPRVCLSTPVAVLRAFRGRDDGSNANALTSSVACLFQDLIVRGMLSKPQESRLVVVESAIFPHRLRAAIADAALSVLHAPSIAFIRQPVAAALGAAGWTALVVDVGYRDSRVIPVIEGRVIENASKAHPVGSEYLTVATLSLLTMATRRALSPSVISTLLHRRSESVSALAAGPLTGQPQEASILHSALSIGDAANASSVAHVMSSLPVLRSAAARPASSSPCVCLGASIAVARAFDSDLWCGISGTDRWLWRYGQVGIAETQAVHADGASLTPRDCCRCVNLAASVPPRKLSDVLDAVHRDAGVGSRMLSWAGTVLRAHGSVGFPLTAAGDAGTTLRVPVPNEVQAWLASCVRAVDYVVPPVVSVSAAVAAAATEAGALVVSIDPLELRQSCAAALAVNEGITTHNDFTSEASSAAAEHSVAWTVVVSIMRGLQRVSAEYCEHAQPDRPLQQLIAEALIACPRESRAALAGAVVVCGGGGELRGWAGALLCSIVQAVDPAVSDPLTLLLQTAEATIPEAAVPVPASSKSPLYELRPLLRHLRLAAMHPPVSAAFAGASIFAAAATSTQTDVSVEYDSTFLATSDRASTGAGGLSGGVRTDGLAAVSLTPRMRHLGGEFVASQIASASASARRPGWGWLDDAAVSSRHCFTAVRPALAGATAPTGVAAAVAPPRGSAPSSTTTDAIASTAAAAAAAEGPRPAVSMATSRSSVAAASTPTAGPAAAPPAPPAARAAAPAESIAARLAKVQAAFKKAGVGVSDIKK